MIIRDGVAVAVLDARAPTESPKTSFTDTWPVGGVVSYGVGPRGGGERRHGVIVAWDEGAKTVELLDGGDRVQLRKTALGSAVLVARSADAYARRTVERARQLQHERSWCSVPSNAFSELNRTPARDVDDDDVVRVVVTTESHFVMRPGQRSRDVDPRLGGEKLLDGLRRTWYASGPGGGWEGADWAYVPDENRYNVRTTMRVVDEFPPVDGG